MATTRSLGLVGRPSLLRVVWRHHVRKSRGAGPCGLTAEALRAKSSVSRSGLGCPRLKGTEVDPVGTCSASASCAPRGPFRGHRHTAVTGRERGGGPRPVGPLLLPHRLGMREMPSAPRRRFHVGRPRAGTNKTSPLMPGGRGAAAEAASKGQIGWSRGRGPSPRRRGARAPIHHAAPTLLKDESVWPCPAQPPAARPALIYAAL